MIQRVGGKHVDLRGVGGSLSLGFRCLELALDEVESLVVALSVVLVFQEASFEGGVQVVAKANLHDDPAEVGHPVLKHTNKSPRGVVALPDFGEPLMQPMLSRW